MVTIDLNTGEIIEGSFERDRDTIPDENINGIDYVIDREVTFSRADTPDILYEIVPSIDDRTKIEITFEDSLEIIRLSELENDELTMWSFIPLQWKLGGRPSIERRGEERKESLAGIAEGVSTVSRQQSNKPRETTEEDIHLNLNHLINHRK